MNLRRVHREASTSDRPVERQAREAGVFSPIHPEMPIIVDEGAGIKKTKEEERSRIYLHKQATERPSRGCRFR